MVLFSTDRVLVPTDFSEKSLQAIRDTLAFVEEASALHVIHILRPLEATDPGVIWDSVDEESRKKNVQHLFSEKFAEDPYQGINFDIEVGDPAAEIIDYAEKHKINLIVIPSRGRTGIARFFMGSTAERVIRFAHCPVLVLKH